MKRLYSGICLAMLAFLAANSAWATPPQQADEDTNKLFRQIRLQLADLQRYRRLNLYDSAMQAAYGIYQRLQPYKNSTLYLEGAYQYGDLARSLRRYDDGLGALQEGLQYAKDPVWRAKLSNRAAALFYEQGKLDSTIVYARTSIALAPAGHRDLAFANHWLLGALYRTRENYGQAVQELRTALHLAGPDDRDNLSTILTHLGIALQGLGRDKAALDTLKLAVADAEAHGTLPQQSFSTGEYCKALFRAGHTEEGLRMMAIFVAKRDSFRLSEKNNTLALMEAREQISREQAHNAELEKLAVHHSSSQRMLLLGGLGAVLVAATLAVFLYTARRQKKLIGSQNDILFLQQAELEGKKEALERLNASKDVLLSVVSHDVRGPLLTLGTTLKLLAEGHLDENETRLILDGLASRVSDTETLLNDVLLWTKGHMSGLTAEPVVMDPEPLVQEVIRQSRPLLDMHKVQVDVAGQPQPVLADEGLLKVVIRNLLSNAIRYGGKEKRVHIQFAHAGQEFGISISDHGSGMPAELVERLTNPHSEDLPSRAMLSLGGLGLVLVKDFVRRQAGRLSVDSTSRGTTITVWLPAGELKAAPKKELVAVG